MNQLLSEAHCGLTKRVAGVEGGGSLVEEVEFPTLMRACSHENPHISTAVQECAGGQRDVVGVHVARNAADQVFRTFVRLTGNNNCASAPLTCHMQPLFFQLGLVVLKLYKIQRCTSAA